MKKVGNYVWLQNIKLKIKWKKWVNYVWLQNIKN